MGHSEASPVWDLRFPWPMMVLRTAAIVSLLMNRLQACTHSMHTTSSQVVAMTRRGLFIWSVLPPPAHEPMRDARIG